MDGLPGPEHLFDRPVPDRVHAHLQPGPVPVVEEPFEDLVVERESPALVAIRVRRLQRGRARPDRAVDREITADRVETELDRLRHIHRAEHDLHRGGESPAVSQQDLDVAHPELEREGHLVDRGHAVRRRRPGAEQLQLLDAVHRSCGGDPQPHLAIGGAGDQTRRAAARIAIDAGGLERVGEESNAARVHEGDVSIGAPNDEGDRT